MISIIGEHSVDLDLLPEQATILDAGCRGFDFTNYFRERGHLVIALDIDYLEGAYNKLGLSTVEGKGIISNHADPQARMLAVKIPGSLHFKEGEVQITTIEKLEQAMGKFDLIKLDIEGEEYDILKESTHPLAHQVSVEFHAHCGQQTKEVLDHLLDYLSEWYTIHNKVWESRHGAGFNYWDVLLIAK